MVYYGDEKILIMVRVIQIDRCNGFNGDQSEKIFYILRANEKLNKPQPMRTPLQF